MLGEQEGAELGGSRCGCAHRGELLPSPAVRTASAQESLFLGELKGDLDSGGKRKLGHTWKSLRTSVSSEVLPCSTEGVENLQRCFH